MMPVSATDIAANPIPDDAEPPDTRHPTFGALGERKDQLPLTSLSATVAIWTLTAGGVDLGRRLKSHLDNAQLYAADAVKPRDMAAETFDRLRDAVAMQFNRYEAHVFIMATGIVVRILADLIRHKSVDPAVVVMDETGRHAISLLSGHLGGANALTRQIAEALGADPVITTATDLRDVPAIDLIARERGLAIENHAAIRVISAALLRGETMALYDPGDYLQGALAGADVRLLASLAGDAFDAGPGRYPLVVVDDNQIDLPPEVLILRPATLFVGCGCNRGTPASEIRELLETVLARHGLAPKSLAGFASVDLKSDETGILEIADEFGLPLVFFSREQLAQVADILNPSATVEKHIGIPSVCEAAALLSAGNGNLIVPKQTTRNVTVAVARRSYTLSE